MKPFDSLLKKSAREAGSLVYWLRTVWVLLLLVVGYFLKSDYEYRYYIIAASLIFGIILGVFNGVYTSKRFKCPYCGAKIPVGMIKNSSDYELNNCPNCGKELDFDQAGNDLEK